MDGWMNEFIQKQHNNNSIA